jgi:hypothetical protein
VSVDIHKPKAWRGWREFLKEYGIIVLSVLTALAAEQAVEHVRETQHAYEARDNIRAELAANLGYILLRSSVETCVSVRLDEVDGLLQAGAKGQPLPEPIWIGHPIHYPMRDSQYRAAAQAGRLSLLPTTEQGDYARIYASLAEYGEASKAEMDAWASLRILERRPVYSPVMDFGLRTAAQQARQARWNMEILSSSIQRNADQLGVRPARIDDVTRASTCLPLRTARPDGLRQVVEGRISHRAYDEP